MKKASLGVGVFVVLLIISAIAMTINLTDGTSLVKADPETCNGADDDGDGQ